MRFYLGTGVFWKQLIIFSLILLPMYTMISVSLWYGSNVITEEVQRSQRDKIGRIIARFEHELQNVHQLLVVLQNSLELNRYFIELEFPYSYRH